MAVQVATFQTRQVPLAVVELLDRLREYVTEELVLHLLTISCLT
jgi:hypothetical protein